MSTQNYLLLMLNEDKIIGIYCIVDDLFKGISHAGDGRRKVGDSEIITTALVAALYFGGHLDNSRGFMKLTKLVRLCWTKTGLATAAAADQIAFLLILSDWAFSKKHGWSGRICY